MLNNHIYYRFSHFFPLLLLYLSFTLSSQSTQVFRSSFCANKIILTTLCIKCVIKFNDSKSLFARIWINGNISLRVKVFSNEQLGSVEVEENQAQSEIFYSDFVLQREQRARSSLLLNEITEQKLRIQISFVGQYQKSVGNSELFLPTHIPIPQIVRDEKTFQPTFSGDEKLVTFFKSHTSKQCKRSFEICSFSQTKLNT